MEKSGFQKNFGFDYRLRNVGEVWFLITGGGGGGGSGLDYG